MSSGFMHLEFAFADEKLFFMEMKNNLFKVQNLKVSGIALKISPQNNDLNNPSSCTDPNCGDGWIPVDNE